MGANPFIHVVSLLVGSEVHKQGLIRRVRDGEDISIWSNPWVPIQGNFFVEPRPDNHMEIEKSLTSNPGRT